MHHDAYDTHNDGEHRKSEDASELAAWGAQARSLHRVHVCGPSCQIPSGMQTLLGISDLHII